MANKSKKSTKSSTVTSSRTKVTRIKADDTKPAAANKPAKAVRAKVTTKTKAKPSQPAARKSSSRNPLRAIGGYFKGAWYELMQVHWPNRRATWNMTVALILFTALFVVIILLLDALFQWLFKQIII